MIHPKLFLAGLLKGSAFGCVFGILVFVTVNKWDIALVLAAIGAAEYVAASRLTDSVRKGTL